MDNNQYKRKLCIVIQRYGTEIMGGAESYARTYAERLAAHGYEVDVLATCALDYQAWENYYPEATQEINGVTVHRFLVDQGRDEKNFGPLTQALYYNPAHTLSQTQQWIDMQGPISYGLLQYITDHKDEFDLFLFMAYLYHPTAVGLGLAPEKAILVPFAHDEPPVYFKAYDKVFSSPRGIIFNTSEEMDFVHHRFHNDDIPSILTGIGLDIPPLNSLPDAKQKFKLDAPFILYMGRIDVSKGCDKLFSYFLEYKRRMGGDLKLALIGSEVLPIPKHKDIVYLGFVSEEEKYAILRECSLLVLPSEFESLSIVVLEALALNKPVLVNGRCQVLRGHCKKSNAGLYYFEQEDFIECLSLLESRPDLRDAMGKNGVRYVDENYQWDVILEKMDAFFEDLLSSAK